MPPSKVLYLALKGLFFLRVGMNDSAGIHIIMDARVDASSAFERGNLINLFKRLTAALMMKALSDIQVYEVPLDPSILERAKATGVMEDEGGTSVLLVITTSHLAIHVWPLQKYFALDVFSCKDFDVELALATIHKHMPITTENTLIIKRKKPAEDGNNCSVRWVV